MANRRESIAGVKIETNSFFVNVCAINFPKSPAGICFATAADSSLPRVRPLIPILVEIRSPQNYHPTRYEISDRINQIPAIPKVASRKIHNPISRPTVVATSRSLGFPPIDSRGAMCPGGRSSSDFTIIEIGVMT